MLGDYFQAAETFFRLERMNHWSKAFYHYVATCCMFADEEYVKAGLEFLHIPTIIKRKRQLGGRLLPNEIYAERKVRTWKTRCDLMHTSWYQQVPVNPLWELIYLWNGFSQLSITMLEDMKQTMEESVAGGADVAQLYLLLGVTVRELGDYDLADMYLRLSIRTEETEERWVVPYALYEMAALACIRFSSAPVEQRPGLIQESLDWIKQSERCWKQPDEDPMVADGDSDWDSRLHIKYQLLKEKLQEYSD